jgi:hypothetical protein
MITADEARAKSIAGQATQQEINRNSLIKAIHDACDEGHFHAAWYHDIDGAFIETLADKGFHVQRIHAGEHYASYRIEWS